MLSFTKPTLDQDGEEIAPDTDAASSEVSPLFGEADRAPGPAPVEPAYEPAVRNQIQRVRLDLLSRETERLEQQLRQVLAQQNEDRQLREELRGQIAGLSQRLETLLAGGAAKAAESGGNDGELRAAVKPLLLAVMQMLDSSEPAGPAEAATAAQSSDTWAQIDAARGEAAPAETSSKSVEAPVQETEKTASETQPEPAGASEPVAETVGPKAPEPDLPGSDEPPATAAVSEEDLDPDPEAELRVEIARLLRPKKAGGGYGPLGSRAERTAEPAEAGRSEAELARVEPAKSEPAITEPTAVEMKPEPSPPEAAPASEPEPLLLGTDQTPKLDDAPPAKPRVKGAEPDPKAEPPRVSVQDRGLGEGSTGRAKPSGEPKADVARGELRGGGAVPRNQRPSWAPRPNPMRASLPKCLTEPWEEPNKRQTSRWPFRRTRPAGGRNDPKK